MRRLTLLLACLALLICASTPAAAWLQCRHNNAHDTCVSQCNNAYDACECTPAGGGMFCGGMTFPYENETICADQLQWCLSDCPPDTVCVNVY